VNSQPAFSIVISKSPLNNFNDDAIIIFLSPLDYLFKKMGFTVKVQEDEVIATLNLK